MEAPSPVQQTSLVYKVPPMLLTILTPPPTPQPLTGSSKPNPEKLSISPLPGSMLYRPRYSPYMRQTNLSKPSNNIGRGRFATPLTPREIDKACIGTFRQTPNEIIHGPPMSSTSGSVSECQCRRKVSGHPSVPARV